MGFLRDLWLHALQFLVQIEYRSLQHQDFVFLVPLRYTLVSKGTCMNYFGQL